MRMRSPKGLVMACLSTITHSLVISSRMIRITEIFNSKSMKYNGKSLNLIRNNFLPKS